MICIKRHEIQSSSTILLCDSTMKSFEKICVLLAFFAAEVCLGDDTSFIVGGIPADVKDFPHKLALLDMIRGSKKSFQMSFLKSD